jgi:hypothetical protein
MTVDVQGCTNALKDRMSEKGHPEHRRSLPSMATRHTVHPEHRRSLPSMATRHTVHPEHKKQPAGCFFIFIHLIN